MKSASSASSRVAPPAPLRAWTWRHAFCADPRVKTTTRLLLHTVGMYMDEVGGGCFPSIKQLMEKSGLSNRAVLDHLAEAVRLGYLERGQHGFRGQRWKRAEYRAALPPHVELGVVADHGDEDDEEGESFPPTAEGGAPGTPRSGEGGERRDAKAVNDAHQDKNIPAQHSSSVLRTARRSAARSPPTAMTSMFDFQESATERVELIPPRPIDATAALWSEGRSLMQRWRPRSSDQTVRRMLGRMVKAAGGDAALVIAVLLDANCRRLIDPPSWVMAALVERAGTRPKGDSVQAVAAGLADRYDDGG